MPPIFQFYNKIPEGVNTRWHKIIFLRKWLFWTQNSYYKFSPLTPKIIFLKWPRIAFKLFKPFKNWQTRSGIIPFRTAVPAEGTCKHYIVLTSMANYNIRRKLPILSEMVWADSQQLVQPSRTHWVDMTYIGFSHRDRC